MRQPRAYRTLWKSGTLAVSASGVLLATAAVATTPLPRPEEISSLVVELDSGSASEFREVQKVVPYPVERIDQDIAGQSSTAAPEERLDHFVEVIVPKKDEAEYRQALEALPGVSAVESNGFAAPITIPSDPRFQEQWGLHHAANAADINALEAWDVAKGSENVTIAIVDTGMDLTHPEFQGKLWKNTGETPGNGIDDDRNGFIDDVDGWDFGYNDNTPTPGGWVGYHGSVVGGVAGAVTDNGVGVAGVDWKARIMPVKVFWDSGWASDTNVARGISYAVANGSKVINLSLGASSSLPATEAAIRDAYAAGVVVVAARGNAGTSQAFYPACSDVDGKNTVIGVAALNSDGTRAYFSSYGPCTDVAAPGASILSTSIGSYAYTSGTSLAAPFVTGAVGVYRSAHPAATVDQVVTAVRDGEALVDASISAKRLSLAKMLGAPAPPPGLPPSATKPANLRQSTDGTGTVTFQTTVSDSNNDPTRLRVETALSGSWRTALIRSVTSSIGFVDVDNSGTFPYQIGSRDRIDTNLGPVTLTITADVTGYGAVEGAALAVRVTPVDEKQLLGALQASDPIVIDLAAPRWVSGSSLFGTSSVTDTRAIFTWSSAVDQSFRAYHLRYSSSGQHLAFRGGAEAGTPWGPEQDPALAQIGTIGTAVTPLTAGTSYRFQLYGVDAYGNVVSSDVLSVTTAVSPSPSPEPPSPSPTTSPTPSIGPSPLPTLTPPSPTPTPTPSITPIPPPPGPPRYGGGEGGGGGTGGGGGPELPGEKGARRPQRIGYERVPRGEERRRREIEDAFRSVFGRRPSPTEQQYWASRLSAGEAPRRLSSAMREEQKQGRTFNPTVFRGVRGAVAAVPSPGAPVVPHVRRTFQQTYGRAPTTTEYRYWLSRVTTDLTSIRSLSTAMRAQARGRPR